MHRVVGPARQATYVDGPIRQPYAGVNYIPQSGTLNLATESMPQDYFCKKMPTRQSNLFLIGMERIRIGFIRFLSNYLTFILAPWDLGGGGGGEGDMKKYIFKNLKRHGKKKKL